MTFSESLPANSYLSRRGWSTAQKIVLDEHQVWLNEEAVRSALSGAGRTAS